MFKLLTCSAHFCENFFAVTAQQRHENAYFQVCGGQLSFSFSELDKSLSEFAPNTMPAFDELNE